ncbi:MAG: DUF4082 domain-containing protein, partial [Pseudobdellovibrionaceae bacterium]
MKTLRGFARLRDKAIHPFLTFLLVNLVFSIMGISISWAGQINLAWDANTQTEVVGYKVYYGTASGQYTQSLDVGNATTASVTGLTAGATYYFVVRDYSAGYASESPSSNEVMGTVAATSPTPAPTPTPTPAPINGGQSLFIDQVPQGLANSDGAGVDYELGMRFTSTASGTINAIKFYKSASESGTHTGTIFSSAGAVLASVVFTNETASGWQQQALSTPLAISANTEYTVSVNTGNTYYVDTLYGLLTAIVNGNLVSVADGNNGVYGPVGSKPTNSYLSSNYFRDVVFVAAGSTVTPTPTPAPT